MKYDFDKITDRRGTCSLKWDVAPGELPLWVADMDFQTAPCVISAVERRAAHGVFGYNVVPDEWYSSIAGWWKVRHGVNLRREALCFCTGAVPAVSCFVRRFTNHGDRVVVMTPAYDIFFHSIENAGRTVAECPLSYDGKTYSLDLGILDRELSHPLATLLVLCNPHNPTGNVWTKEELARIGEMCFERGVTVISDEVHCDLTDPGAVYVPFVSAGEACGKAGVSVLSAGKAFNIAGLQSAAVYAPDERLRNIAVRGLNSDELAEPNTFAAIATAAAFSEGGEWLDELRAYLAENKRFARGYIEKNIGGLTVVGSRATYLMWIDVGGITDDGDAFAAFLREKTGLYLCGGGQYRGNGKRFVRLNAACPRSVLSDALRRLEEGARLFGERK